MKEKIIYGVVGLLIGSIITASCFVVFERKHKNNMQMPRDGKMQMMERPDGKEMPNGKNSQDQKEKRPELPNDDDSSKDKKQTKDVM
jgi:hypothetical protein